MASKHYHFKFNFDSDKEIISRIEAQDNKNDYIRSLILSDMAADILRESIKLEEQDLKASDEEFRKQCDIMDSYCKARMDPDSGIETCEGCPYSYHVDNFSDKISCKFMGLSSKEMEELVHG